MIVYFPEVYPDELLYSVLARFYAKSGYLSYMFVTQEIYKRQLQKPSIEFINQLNPEIVQILTKDMSMEQLIEKHTMFPYYGRFMKPDRRQKMFEKLINMDTGDGSSNMGLPRNKNRLDRYVRYCPLCAKEDRELYGETYWHRTHQILGLSVCPKHKCLLKHSGIIMNRNNTTVLLAAEASGVDEDNVTISQNDFENDFSEYLATVFQSNMNMSENTDVGLIMQKWIEKSKYILPNGVNKNIMLMYSDFSKWYQRKESCFSESWQIGKILTNDRSNFADICALAMFLGISAADMTQL